MRDTVTRFFSFLSERHFFVVVAVVMIAMRLVVQMVISLQMPLTEDEMYYWYWSQHLAWAYPEHPPMIAFFYRLVSELLGQAFYVYRLFALILLMGLSVVLYFFGRYLTGKNWTGWMLVVIFYFVPHFLGSALVVTTDTPMIFFLFLSLYFYTRAFFPRHDKNVAGDASVKNVAGSGKIASSEQGVDTEQSAGSGWNYFFAGLFMGASILAKLSSLLVVLTIALYALVSQKRKFYLKNPYFYFSFFVIFVVCFPCFWWNVNNDFILLRQLNYMTTKETNSFYFRIFYQNQFFLAGPLLMILLPKVVFFFVSRYYDFSPFSPLQKLRSWRQKFLLRQSFFAKFFKFSKDANFSKDAKTFDSRVESKKSALHRDFSSDSFQRSSRDFDNDSVNKFANNSDNDSAQDFSSDFAQDSANASDSAKNDLREKAFFLAFIVLLQMSYLVLKSFFSVLHPNWSLFVVVSFCPLAAIFLGQIKKKNFYTFLNIYHAAITAIVIILAYFLLFLSPDLLKRFPSTVGTTSVFYSYKVFGEEFGDYYQKSMDKKMLIAGNNYQIPSLIHYHWKPTAPALTVRIDDYHYTIFDVLAETKSYVGKDIYYILRQDKKVSPKGLAVICNNVEKIKTFSSKLHGQPIAAFDLYRCGGFLGSPYRPNIGKPSILSWLFF